MTKYLTLNSIRLEFVHENNKPNPPKSLEYIKFYSSSSLRLNECPRILSDTTVRRSGVKREGLSLTFVNTGTKDETFQQSGKQDSFRHILKSPANIYKSAD